MEHVLSTCRFEYAAHPSPTLHGVACEVEDDRGSGAQYLRHDRRDDFPASSRRSEVVVERANLEAERGDPLVFANDHRGQCSSEPASKQSRNHRELQRTSTHDQMRASAQGTRTG
jgi:hypothetical protein